MEKLILALVIYAIGFVVTFIITRLYGITGVRGTQIPPVTTSIMESLLWVIFWLSMGVVIIAVGIWQIAVAIKDN